MIGSSRLFCVAQNVNMIRDQLKTASRAALLVYQEVSYKQSAAWTYSDLDLDLRPMGYFDIH